MKRAARVSAWIGGIVLLFAIVFGALIFAFFQKFYPSVPEMDFPLSRTAAGAQRQDLAYFRNYFQYNKAYSADALKKAKVHFAQTESRSGQMTRAEFALAIAQMVALSDNGHSTLFMGPLSRSHNRIPCRLYYFSDGFYIIRARGACTALIGAKVVAIDGRPVHDAVTRMYAYSGGPWNHYLQFKAPFFLESPELLHAAAMAARPDHEILRVQMLNGIMRDVTVGAEPPDDEAPRVYSDAYLSPQHIAGEPSDWKTFLTVTDEKKLPLFLQRYDNPFQYRFLTGKNAAYIQFRSNASEPGHPIDAFVNRVEAAIKSDKPEFVILDLRLDQGGNFTTTASLMMQIARLAPSIKHVYVLTSAWTFSAGIVSTALAKYHGGKKLTIIGAPVGDRMQFWAEGGDMVLPHSKLDIGFATGWHNYRHPCWGERGCFWILVLYPTHLKTLTPDVRVLYSFSDYTALRDPLLDTALALAAKT